MDSLLASFEQVLRNLCLSKPWQSREPLPGHCCPGTTPHSNCHILTPLIEVFLRILKFARHKLRIADGLTLVTSKLHGWEAFPTPGALTHTRITWGLSSTGLQVPGVTPGSPLCPWCFRHSSWRSVQQSCLGLLAPSAKRKCLLGPHS